MMTADRPSLPTRANLFSKCKEFPGGRQIEVAPGKTVFPAPDDIDLPKVALVSWQKIGPSEYRPVVRIHERWVRLTGALPEHLGMGIDYNTLMRLIKAGFVASRRPAPNTTVIDVESWFEHLHASSDPEFWDLLPGGPPRGHRGGAAQARRDHRPPRARGEPDLRCPHPGRKRRAGSLHLGPARPAPPARQALRSLVADLPVTVPLEKRTPASASVVALSASGATGADSIQAEVNSKLGLTKAVYDKHNS